jgi:chaperonin cofactor prefoldin
MKDYKEARRDYESALEKDGSITDAAAGLTRCEVHLGMPPSAGRFESGRAMAKQQQQPRMRVSDEDARALADAQTRVKDIKKQQLRGGEQKRLAELEKRRSELTLAQLEKLPQGRAVYSSMGRMYVRSTNASVVSKLEDEKATAEKKLRVCVATIEHLARQEKEADATFLELVNGLRRKGGA